MKKLCSDLRPGDVVVGHWDGNDMFILKPALILNTLSNVEYLGGSFYSISYVLLDIGIKYWMWDYISFYEIVG